MAAENPISMTEAVLADGSVIAYRDSDPSHIREDRFRHVLGGSPVFFRVTLEGGGWFGVDLSNGNLYAPGGFCCEPDPAVATPLRLIYYKRMHQDVSARGASETVMEFFVVGWRATVDGRNRRLGLKVYPDQLRYEVTEDI